MKNLFKNFDLFKGKANAFTLAETLITLGIIGVVAAITIPNLVTNYQKKQTAIHLKKVYSEITQAVTMAQVQHGPMEKWNFANYNNDLLRNVDFFEDYLLSNIKISKKCAPSSSECWADKILTLDNIEADSMVQNNKGTRVSFVTVSGYSVFGWLHADGTGGWFFVDLNGPNAKPNQLGKDIFTFMINWKPVTTTKFGVFPAGFHIRNVKKDDLINNPNGLLDSVKNCLCKKGENLSRAGALCGAVIMLDDWEIKDDYPW